MDRSSPVRSWTSGRIRTVYGSTSAGQGNRPTTLSLRPSTGPCGPNVWTHIGSRRSQKRRRESKLGGRNIMRVALTGRWARGHRTKSPVSSRLAANSLANKLPKTHSRSDTGKGDRSPTPGTHIMIGTENGGRSSELQDLFDKLGKGTSYGPSTTHWNKLIPKVDGGGAGGYPKALNFAPNSFQEL